MWTEIISKEKEIIFLKYAERNDCHCFFVTDFIRMWGINLTEKELFLLIQENNPLLEATDSQKLITFSIDTLLESISNKTVDSDVTLFDDKSCLKLKFKMRKDDSPLRFKFRFLLSNPESFCQEITMALLNQLKEVQSSEEQLLDVVLKKDVEISEYRAEGAILPLKHLETKIFNEYEHNNIYKSSKDFAIFPGNILSNMVALNESQSVKIIEKNSNIKEKLDLDEKTNSAVNIYENIIQDMPLMKSEPQIQEVHIKTESKTQIPIDLESDSVKRRKRTKRPLNF